MLRVSDFGFSVYDLGFWVEGLGTGYKIWGSGGV
jgi:hypothetical protein